MAFVEVFDGGYAQPHEALPTFVTANILGVARRFWEQSWFYGSDGSVWRSVPADPMLARPGLVARALAVSIYNPRRAFPLTYEREGEYALAELKARIRECVDRDDDILTQFMDAGEIKARLEKATQFEDIVSLLRATQEEQGEGAAQR